MKRFINITILTGLLFLYSAIMFAQSPPHPNDGISPGTNNTRVGDAPAGAPIGGGAWILITLSVSYGFRRWYLLRSESTMAE